jgi:type IV pilus assembly protein PilV
LIANYGTATGAQYLAWKTRVAQTLPGVTDDNLPVIGVDADNTVTVTVYWQAPAESGRHNYVAVTRIHN